jgi:hypothetical protein
VIHGRDFRWSAPLAVEVVRPPTRRRAADLTLLERAGPSPVARSLAVIGD